jgi:hypothetical protein
MKAAGLETDIPIILPLEINNHMVSYFVHTLSIGVGKGGSMKNLPCRKAF